MKWLTVILAAATVLIGSATLAADRKRAPDGAQVYIIWPRDGQTIQGAFWLRMGLTNVMGIAPAGVAKDNTGHHHVLVDTDLPANMDETIPNDKNHLHFGAGQTEARLDLPPGRHTLQLILGDENHVPFEPPIVSKKITVNVVQ